MADRKENVENEDIVVWHSFGLTHNPRIEGQPPPTLHPYPHLLTRLTSFLRCTDWPVMYAALPTDADISDAFLAFADHPSIIQAG
jgi:Cu2+-containing amine oxidase